jgi:hypothetical protein
MLALTGVDQGDVAVRSDVSKAFILRQLPSTTLANWVELLTPASTVTSVSGKVGAVVLNSNDVGLANVPNTNFTSAVTANTSKITNATHTGDVTGSAALTLATVNANVGTFNNVAVNGKGLVTSASNVTYATGSGSATGTNTGDQDLSTKANIASPTFTGTVSGITKSMVGLSNVPNLSFSGTNTGDQDLANYVTLNGAQTITGAKTMTGVNAFNGTLGATTPSSVVATTGVFKVTNANNKVLIVEDNARRVNIGRDEISVTDLAGTGSLMQLQNSGNINIASGGGTTAIGGVATISPTGLAVTGTVTATGGNSTNWNTAFSWGDHGTANYVQGLGYANTDANTYSTNSVRSNAGLGGSFLYSPILTSVTANTLSQLNVNYATGNLRTRGGNSSGSTISWTPWRTVWDSLTLTNLDQLSNGPGYLTAATASYLPLAGGTMSNTNKVINLNADLLDGLDSSVLYKHMGNISANTNADTLPTGVWKHVGQSGITNFAQGYGTTFSIDTGSYYGWQLNADSGGHLYNRTKHASWTPWRAIWDSDNLTNLNQLSNGPGYITGYSETDTFQTVTNRNATSTNIVGITADGAGNDPYGRFSVTRGTASNFAYYGLTRAANVGWSIGINTSNQLMMGTGASGGNIVTIQAFKLSGGGDGIFSGSATATSFFQSSDIRLKNIIKRDGDVIYYTWKDNRDTKTHIGYIAQKVRATNPDQVNKDDKGYLSVNYIEILVEKIRNLEKEIELLKAK